jgi:uncharacterized protein
MTLIEYLLIALSAIGAGMVNALAGGGTLLTFPMLLAIGIPAVNANVTSTISLCPGYFGAALGQRKDLAGQKRRIWLCLPAAAAGGLMGGLLLLNTGERLFRDLVPFLILLASVLLAIQDPVRSWLNRRARQSVTKGVDAWVIIPVMFAAVYGGYFGAGLSVIVLAILALILDDTLTRLNGLKQVVSLSTNIAAALLFIFSPKVEWFLVPIMAVGALLGGNIGGRLAGRIKPATLRFIVIAIGIGLSIYYFTR